MRKPCCEKTETTKGAWSKQEDQKLIDYIKKHGQGCWNSLPKAAGLRRCGKSCRLRWKNYLRPGLKHGSFGEDEEDLIIRLHALLGNRWSLIAGRLPGRTDNEVKNYWNSHIRKKLFKMGTTTITTTSTITHHVHHHHPDINYKPLPAADTRKPFVSSSTNKVVNLGHDTNKYDQEVSDSISTSPGTAAISNTSRSSCLPDLNLKLDHSLIY